MRSIELTPPLSSQLSAEDEVPTADIVKSIMTPEDFVNLERPIQYPHTIELSSVDKKIIYIGAKHSMDPKDKLFNRIEDEFNALQPDVVIVEGLHDLAQRIDFVKDEIAKLSRDEIIQKYGESFFTLSLALKNNIEVLSPEVSVSDEIKLFEGKEFSRDAIFAYYCARRVQQYQRMGVPRPDFEKYMEPLRQELQIDSAWHDFDFSLDHFAAISKEHWGVDLDPLNPLYSEKVDPMPWESKKDIWGVTNEISQALNHLRDEHMLKIIDGLKKTHDRIFVVFGSSHAIMQEPALEKMFPPDELSPEISTALEDGVNKKNNDTAK